MPMEEDKTYISKFDERMRLTNHKIISISKLMNQPYKVKMLLRCTTMEYARRFINTGNIRFSLPEEWVDVYYRDGEGRGDELEGCYACLVDFDRSCADFYLDIRDNSKIRRDQKDNNFYFYSTDVLKMRTLCFYGVNLCDFDIVPSKDQKKNYLQYILSKKYFDTFLDTKMQNISRNEYDGLPEEQKPVLLMIRNPVVFFERLKRKLISIGIRQDEFSIQPVAYYDKRCEYVVNEMAPSELYLKDDSFEYQKEIRVVIHSTRSGILKMLNKCNGIIDIGSMDDIAMIQDYYLDDMTLFIEDEHILYYSLPKEITAPIDSCERGYINEYNQKNVGMTNNPGKYNIECLNCHTKYISVGIEIWKKKCPYCQRDRL